MNERKHTQRKKKQDHKSRCRRYKWLPSPSGEIVQMQGRADKSITQWHHNGPPLCGRFRALPERGTTSAQSALTAAGMDIPTRGWQLSEGGLTFNKSSFEVGLQMNVPPPRQQPAPNPSLHAPPAHRHFQEQQPDWGTKDSGRRYDMKLFIPRVREQPSSYSNAECILKKSILLPLDPARGGNRYLDPFNTGADCS